MYYNGQGSEINFQCNILSQRSVVYTVLIGIAGMHRVELKYTIEDLSEKRREEFLLVNML